MPVVPIPDQAIQAHGRITETDYLTDYLIYTLPVEAAQVKYSEFVLKSSILNIGITSTAYCGWRIEVVLFLNQELAILILKHAVNMNNLNLKQKFEG